MGDRVVVVDVGGLGGIQECWRTRLDEIVPVLFEPNPPEAMAIRAALTTSAEAIVVECALGDREERRKLRVAKSLGCTSVLVPNRAFLAPYSVAPAFRTTHEVEVDCHRYDTLYKAGRVPAPDAIKVDVQGFEYQVLNGFGELLRGCLGVQIEAHFYPIYEGQRLLNDVVSLLGDYGLCLRRLEPVAHFDGDLVEVDAWFTCDLRSTKSLNESQIRKLEMICEVWGIPQRSNVFGERQFE